MIKRLTFLSAAAALLAMSSPGFAQVVLNVDQATGLVEIHNTSDTATVNLNSYDLRSLQNVATNGDGLLNANGWTKLQTSVGNGWLATNFPTNERLLETNANNVLSLAPGAKQSLGGAFTTSGAAIGAAQTRVGFGNEYRDLTFQYTDADANSAIVDAVVNYSNPIFNNLVLDVDRSSGNITLKNESSVAVQIEAYTITSEAGSLNTDWNGLSDTVANWQKNVGTPNALAELSSMNNSTGNPLAPLTINGGASFDLGTAFNAGGTEDLAFSFLLTSDTAGNGFAGAIRYVGGGGLVGDYNGDGFVNLADYTVWRDTLGSTTNLAADGNNNNSIDAGDYGVWKSNFGSSAGSVAAVSSAQVPEPSTVVLLSLLATVGFVARRR
ncbi:PEP-CTERM sorting domain-containing protein [Aeoliella sp. SH292]|uniref:PEP-CTERM sorting domain-containing protein n=1 Tax=Aeoliella sp. SH292 TaxID=3454464 RepID=UPI003F9BEA9C